MTKLQVIVIKPANQWRLLNYVNPDNYCCYYFLFFFYLFYLPHILVIINIIIIKLDKINWTFV